MTHNTTKIQGKFYPLTPDVAKKPKKAKLTAAEWRFWTYLVELNNSKLALAQATCLEIGITVTFKEVQP
ncbi:hypothetical protein [Calothrix sp. CCY 0018]|uniref:hypothetical protein n=1 Tax=Calothrix sp. CCY 0018 TaxID=3103864 RepID=UPI0039C62292